MIRGDIHLYEFAAPDKRRPVLILTRSQAIPHLSTVTVAPVTSTIRDTPSQVLLGEEDGMKHRCCVNCHQITTVPKGKIGRRLTSLSHSRMRQVMESIQFCLALDDDSAELEWEVS
jgi:mRNA interferase MazF